MYIRWQEAYIRRLIGRYVQVGSVDKHKNVILDGGFETADFKTAVFCCEVSVKKGRQYVLSDSVCKLSAKQEKYKGNCKESPICN